MYKIQEKILSLFAFAFKRLLCQVLYNLWIPVCKLHPNHWSRTGREPSLRGQIVEGLSLIASGRYLSHWLNFILSKQPRSPATECRNPGAPGLNQECRLLLFSRSTGPNIDFPYYRALPYKNKHYNKSSMYDRMKFKIKLNQMWLLSVWVGSSMRYFRI